MPTVAATALTMTYRVPVRQDGLSAAVRALFHREFREVPAVRAVSFALEPGEVVGFIGPNGAGKTTTLKMLSGVLHPTGGAAQVLGCEPWRREYRFLRQIAMVRGSRPLAAPAELTVADALRYQQRIYEVPEEQFRRNVAELVEMLNLEPVLPRQVRALSLGERMRSGLAWSLLYRPRVLFLDEPTLGLDVSAAAAMRRFIAAYAHQTGATVMLTSHYMADVEILCPRVILIDQGAVVYDGRLSALAGRLAPQKLLKLTVAPGPEPEWGRYGEVVSAGEGRVVLRVERSRVSAVTARLLAEAPVEDLAIEEPALESVLAQIYAEGVPA